MKSINKLSDFQVDTYGDTALVTYKQVSTDSGHKLAVLNGDYHLTCLDTYVKTHRSMVPDRGCVRAICAHLASTVGCQQTKGRNVEPAGNRQANRRFAGCWPRGNSMADVSSIIKRWKYDSDSRYETIIGYGCFLPGSTAKHFDIP